MNIYICSECVKEIHLKTLISNSLLVDNCSFCNNVSKIVDCEESEFYYLLKSLIRYYYNEWDYNSHWGGDDIYKLIEKDDLFFNLENFSSPELIEYLTDLIDNFEAYEGYSEGICLYAGYDEDGNQQMLLRALKDEVDFKLDRTIRRLKSENYFNLEEELIERLKLFIEKSKCEILADTIYYRARIGYSKKDYDYLDGGMEGKYIYFPYSKNEIANPPPHLTESGRLNRAGVSFLYCATDEDTAISEVRPHPGDKVSVGCFKTTSKISVFNIAKDYLNDNYGTDKLLDDFVYLNSLNKFFQKTIPPTKKENYSITQIIADCIRKLGFDGILYNSSVGHGENLVVFEPKKMQYIENDSKVVVVKNLSYRFETLNNGTAHNSR